MAPLDVSAAMAKYHTKPANPPRTETMNQFLNRLYHTDDSSETVTEFFQDIEAVSRVAAESDGFRWHCTFHPLPDSASYMPR